MMSNTRFRNTAMACATAAAIGLGAFSGAQAAEDDAKALLKAMSDYMASQKQFSMTFDTSLEVVTKDKQKLMLAATGTMEASRPDKLHVTRTGGFADVEFIFDGKTLTVVGKNRNVYVQADMPGTYYQLIDDLREKFHKPLAGADLLAENVNDHLMEGVTDVKDLGSGIIGGKECDHLAFRTAELDWQIWIAQGDQPYPCRYVITSTTAEQAPQFMIDIREFKPGAASTFTFTPPEGAKKLDVSELKALRELGDLPEHFTIGE
jgi:hypothetical protein